LFFEGEEYVVNMTYATGNYDSCVAESTLEDYGRGS
jgi:hypothetical protein